MNDSPDLNFRDTLEQQVGKPRGDWCAQDVVDCGVEAGVRVVSLLHVGGDGWPRTLDFVPRSRQHLLDIVEGGERADGSSLFPDAGIGSDASDIVLRPRPETAFLDPFAERTTLVLRCGHLGRDGKPLPQSPDTILRAAAERVKREFDIELTALGEIEYFLGKPHDMTEVYGRDDRGYHAAAPFVFGQRLRRRAMDLLAGMGVPVKYGHSEVGYIEAHEAEGTQWEQHEIELALQPLPDAADGILLTQWVLRLLARSEGMVCNTDPMMRSGHAGNGLHVHLSAREDSRALRVMDDEGELERHASWLVGGLVACSGALMAFGNTGNRSFARLNQGKEAPHTVRWAPYDRAALIRIPVVPMTAEGRPVAEPTVEFRLPDGSALVHLLFAGIAQAAVSARSRDDLDALLAATSAATPADSAPASFALPRTPAAVGAALHASRDILEAGEVFPPDLIDCWIRRLRDS